MKMKGSESKVSFSKYLVFRKTPKTILFNIVLSLNSNEFINLLIVRKNGWYLPANSKD